MHDVCLAYAHFDTVAATTLEALGDLRAHDAYNSKLIGPKATYLASSTGLVGAVNSISKVFVDDTDADWIFWVDCDMGFEPDTLDRLYAAADPELAPCVSALSFKCQQTEPDNLGGYLTEALPVIMDWGMGKDGSQGFMCRLNYPENTLMQCQATGMACTLIHRSVYEAIREKFGDEWHSLMPTPPECSAPVFTPDVSFWCRASMCDPRFAPFVHTGIWTTHQKTTWVSHPSYVAQVGEVWRNDRPPADVDVVKTAVQNRAERRRLAKAKA